MDIEQDCEICHEEAAELVSRKGLKVCPWCADAIDFEAAMTPEERRAEERSIAAYCDEQAAT
jgi:hypothetical protein